MKIRVGADEFTVQIAKTPLYFKGKQVAGLTLWNEHLILICGQVDPSRRKHVLDHEAREAWIMSGLRPPEDKEHLIDWSGTISRSVERDLAEFGGVPALMKMVPTAETQQPTTAPLDTLHRIKFPHLNEEQYEEAQSLWQSAGLNPWSDQFHVKSVYDQVRRRPSVKLVLNIEGLRARAHATGQYAGNEVASFEYSDSDRIPASCTFTLYRDIEGERQKFSATMLWDECFGADPQQWPDLVAKMPHLCLEIRAEAAGLRRAFPEIKSIYAPEELVDVPEYRAAAMAYPVSKGMPIQEALDEDTPHSSQGLHQLLHEMGFKTQTQRSELMKQVSNEMVRREGDERLFYQNVIRAAKQGETCG